MKQNAAEKALATIDSQLNILNAARNVIVAAMAIEENVAVDKPKRGRKRKAGLPNGAADSAKE